MSEIKAKMMEAAVAKLQATIAEVEVKADNKHQLGDLKQGVGFLEFEQRVEHELHHGVASLEEAIDVLKEILDEAGADGESVTKVCESVKKAIGRKSGGRERSKCLFDFKFVSPSGHGVVVKAYLEPSAKYPGGFDIGALYGRLAFKPAPSYRIVTDSGCFLCYSWHQEQVREEPVTFRHSEWEMISKCMLEQGLTSVSKITA